MLDQEIRHLDEYKQQILTAMSGRIYIRNTTLPITEDGAWCDALIFFLVAHKLRYLAR
jgi:hypothetical protein